MPRCCSRRIQSEVAWRAALRPLTVPAIWIAPPNSSSFSVSVVLPASGCEMIAKVRRRRDFGCKIAHGYRSVVAGAAAAQRQFEDGRILAAVRRLVVTAPGSDVLKFKCLIEADGRRV